MSEFVGLDVLVLARVRGIFYPQGAHTLKRLALQHPFNVLCMAVRGCVCMYLLFVWCCPGSSPKKVYGCFGIGRSTNQKESRLKRR